MNEFFGDLAVYGLAFLLIFVIGRISFMPGEKLSKEAAAIANKIMGHEIKKGNSEASKASKKIESKAAKNRDAYFRYE